MSFFFYLIVFCFGVALFARFAKPDEPEQQRKWGLVRVVAALLGCGFLIFEVLEGANLFFRITLAVTFVLGVGSSSLGVLNRMD